MNSHLSLRELLLYADGELPSRSRRSALAHLHCCWRCRTELERLKQDIGLIVDAQAKPYLPAMQPPTRSWANFEEMTAMLPSSRFRMGAWLHRANYSAHFAVAFPYPDRAIERGEVRLLRNGGRRPLELRR